jgi:hypothetical protein
LSIPTSNANAIYRLISRQVVCRVAFAARGPFLACWRDEDALVTSYGNIVEYVHGCAVMIDLGDKPEGVPQ